MARKHEDAGVAIHTHELRIPPPVPDGTDHLESLGSLVDRLMGDRLVRRHAEDDLRPMMLRDEETPGDPQPVEPPEPVPGGTESQTRGEKPKRA